MHRTVFSTIFVFSIFNFFGTFVQEEERLRKLWEETKARDRQAESDDWDKIEEEARRKADQAKEELREAREREKHANDDKAEAENRRRESFRYNRPTGMGHTSNAEEREEIRRYEEKHGNLEQAWLKFEKRSKSEAFILRYDEVPFLTVGLLYRQMPTFAERQSNFKKLAKRWHPDKFLQRFSGSMAKHDEDRIMEGVKEAFQVVQQHCQKS